MYERRWPVISAVLVALVVAGALGWAVGRSAARDASADGQSRDANAAPVTFPNGVPVATERSRAGALAAADNYVTTATETAIQDPRRYERLVRAVYTSSYQPTALAEAEEVRNKAPELVQAYADGRKGVAVVAARRLDEYTDDKAQVTTWRAGVVWSGTDKPFSQWFLTETTLAWDGDRWRVAKIDDAQRAVPSPPVRFQDRAGLEPRVFERELRGMTAPVYGAAP